MGERGPAKMPTKLKLLHGERRASRLNMREPKVESRPVMPAEMSDAAKRVWRHVMRVFGHTGVITAADRDILQAYCEAVVRYVQASTALEGSGPLVRGARKGELVKNPLHQVVRDNAVLMRAMARELGLTPAARTSLEVPEAGAAGSFEAWEASGS